MIYSLNFYTIIYRAFNFPIIRPISNIGNLFIGLPMFYFIKGLYQRSVGYPYSRKAMFR